MIRHQFGYQGGQFTFGSRIAWYSLYFNYLFERDQKVLKCFFAAFAQVQGYHFNTNQTT